MYKPAFQKTPLAQGIALALGLSTLARASSKAVEPDRSLGAKAASPTRNMPVPQAGSS